jgi:hypothetical protein
MNCCLCQQFVSFLGGGNSFLCALYCGFGVFRNGRYRGCRFGGGNSGCGCRFR